MRELWQIGYIHNRVRMIVGSFLVKNLLLHWHHGERWFWDCLVDADLANNSASWQWIAGCGADAAPYFRIFNPVTQGKNSILLANIQGNLFRSYKTYQTSIFLILGMPQTISYIMLVSNLVKTIQGQLLI